jgi:SAM-dependent methyltransferase
LSDLTPHARRNQEVWTEFSRDYVEPAERSWATDEISWGIWDVPERDVGALDDVELAGKDVVELGCGTAYFSAWFARRGARPVGVDVTEAQLETARRLQAEHGVDFPLVHASAESVPLADASFDLVFSEYGASLWADPYLWIPEAARLLRPGGRLVFMTNSVLAILCMPPGDEPMGPELLRDYFGLGRVEWEDTGEIEFHLGFGDWVRVLRANGFVVDDYVEVGAPEGATTRYPWANPEWARRWPSEEIWKATKRS